MILFFVLRKTRRRMYWISVALWYPFLQQEKETHLEERESPFKIHVMARSVKLQHCVQSLESLLGRKKTRHWEVSCCLRSDCKWTALSSRIEFHESLLAVVGRKLESGVVRTRLYKTHTHVHRTQLMFFDWGLWSSSDRARLGEEPLSTSAVIRSEGSQRGGPLLSASATKGLYYVAAATAFSSMITTRWRHFCTALADAEKAATIQKESKWLMHLTSAIQRWIP